MAVKIESHIDFSSLAWLHEQEVAKMTDFHTKFIKDHQKTPHLPRYFPWQTYKLMAEGHYVQIWASENWNMLIPFIGEGDTLDETHINDSDEENSWPYPCDQWHNNDDDMHDAQSEGDTIPTIDSTHRDF